MNDNLTIITVIHITKNNKQITTTTTEKQQQ